MDIEKLKIILIKFLNSEVVVYALDIYLLGLIVYSVYCVLNYFKYYANVSRQIMTFSNNLNEREKVRNEVERKKRLLYGETSSKDLLGKLDLNLGYSGLKTKYKWLSTELFLIALIIITVLVITAVTVWKGVLLGCVAGAVLIALVVATLNIMIAVRDKKLQSEILQFMNIVENFSSSTDDIVDILRKTSNHIEEPLRGLLVDAVNKAKNSGDKTEALRELQEAVTNKHFKMLIRNLEISSRHETNYADIIQDCRGVFQAYIEGSKEKKNVRMNGIVEIVSMLACGVLCLVIFNQMSESGNLFIDMLNGGIMGKGIIGLMIASTALSGYIIVSKLLDYK